MLLAFPCGLLHGSLTTLGVDCVVLGDIAVMPSCTCMTSRLRAARHALTPGARGAGTFQIKVTPFD